MGVDFYSCDNCNSTFADCGYYVCCEYCGRHWCSDECANEDGHEVCRCKLDKDIDNDGWVEEECDKADDGCCHDCVNFVRDSCKYCRHEDYEDSVLLCKAMDLLNCDRQYLIDKIKDNL